MRSQIKRTQRENPQNECHADGTRKQEARGSNLLDGPLRDNTHTSTGSRTRGGEKILFDPNVVVLAIKSHRYMAHMVQSTLSYLKITTN